jgi:hypothetical protein
VEPKGEWMADRGRAVRAIVIIAAVSIGIIGLACLGPRLATWGTPVAQGQFTLGRGVALCGKERAPTVLMIRKCAARDAALGACRFVRCERLLEFARVADRSLRSLTTAVENAKAAVLYASISLVFSLHIILR